VILYLALIVFLELVNHMTLLEKIIFITMVGIVTYFWNKYAIILLVKKVVKMNSDSNWLAKKQSKIINGFQLFYWFFFLMFMLAIIFSK
jgi:hypothetical protein